MDYRNDPLWQKLAAYTIDDPSASFTFSAKLASQQNWTAEYTVRVIDEYKRFIYLCCISPSGASPSQIVDEAWHLHLTYTIDYWNRFCKETLGKDIHHFPSKGGTEEKAKHTIWYQNTLSFYKETFNEDPPADIWPTPKLDREAKVPLIPGRYFFFEAGSRYRFLLLLIPFILIILLYAQPNPFGLAGPHFMVFYIAFCISVIAVQLISFHAKKHRLAQLLIQEFPTPDKYDLAYMTGGENRFALMVVSDLLNCNIIEPAGSDKYKINYEYLIKSDNLLTETLKEYTFTTILRSEIIAKATYAAGDCRRKFGEISASFNSEWNNIFLPILTLFIGIMRVFQGISNGKPVGNLITLMVVFFFISRLIKTGSKFYFVCREILRTNETFSAGITDNLYRGIIFTGLASLASIPILNHLQTEFRDSYSGDGGGSSCGSSCGGGCGGGCGGCGGS